MSCALAYAAIISSVMATMELVRPARVASASVTALLPRYMFQAPMLEFSASPRSETQRFVRSLEMSSSCRTTILVKYLSGLKSGMMGPGITAIVRFGRLTEMLKSVGVKSKVHCVVLRKASFLPL